MTDSISNSAASSNSCSVRGQFQFLLLFAHAGGVERNGVRLAHQEATGFHHEGSSLRFACQSISRTLLHRPRARQADIPVPFRKPDPDAPNRHPSLHTHGPMFHRHPAHCLLHPLASRSTKSRDRYRIPDHRVERTSSISNSPMSSTCCLVICSVSDSSSSLSPCRSTGNA